MPDVALAPPEIMPLPTAETTVRLPGWVDKWFEKGAPFAVAAAIALPVVAFANGFVIGFAGDGCYDCSAVELYGALTYAGIITLWVLSLATVAGRASAKRAHRDQLAPYLTLGQGAKDWFVRGDITEAEFERLKAVVEPALEGKTEDHRIRKAASFLTWVGTITAILLAPFIFISIIAVAEGGDTPVLFVAFPLFTLFMMVLCATGWTVGLRAQRVAKELGVQTLARIRRAEEEIIKAAHQRSSKGGAAPAASGPAYGPSFKSYSGR